VPAIAISRPVAVLSLRSQSALDALNDRMLGFRNWLRTHDDDRDLYESTKRCLAAQEWQFIQDYADAKSEVVEDIRIRAGLPARVE
jgi:GrpB-like predicted nucleotidyltransferase (UPF0157 family)